MNRTHLTPNDVLKRLQELSADPQAADVASWIRCTDAVELVRAQAKMGWFVLCGLGRRLFVHTVVVPEEIIRSATASDLHLWSGNPSAQWSFALGPNEPSLSAPLSSIGSKAIATGEQLVFLRETKARTPSSYIELSNCFSQALDLHLVPERESWVHIDEHGDPQDIVKVFRNNKHHGRSELFVLARHDAVEDYAKLGRTCIVTMFEANRSVDRTFRDLNARHETQKASRTLYVRQWHDNKSYGYTRGVSINYVTKRQRLRLVSSFLDFRRTTKFATFLAYDWKNKRVANISCSPEKLASYFDNDGRPHQLSPAFFKPDVILKYKSDSDRFMVNERSLSCRESWHLETFDVNDAGQIHTYLCYLSRLPYTEQLYWQSFNEEPRGEVGPVGPIAERAFRADFLGDFDRSYDGLREVKRTLERWREKSVPWWTLRADNLPSRTCRVFTEAVREWAQEIQHLQQLVVEGFEESWLRSYVKIATDSEHKGARSLKLLEVLVNAILDEEQHSKTMLAPLIELNRTRTEVSSHAGGVTARRRTQQAISKCGGLRFHFAALCSDVAECLLEIEQAMAAAETKFGLP